MSEHNNNDKAMFEELQAWINAKGNQQSTAKKVEDIKTLIETATISHPLANENSSQLGSRIDGAVILPTGQIFYEEALIELAGHMPIILSLRYVARESHTGLFGQHWFLAEESRFERCEHDSKIFYRLFLSDGRKFDFPYNAKTNTLADIGNLGVTVRWQKKNAFELHYFSGEIDYYHNNRLVSKVDLNGNSLHWHYDKAGQLKAIENSSGAHLQFAYGKNDLVSQISDHSGRSWQFNYDTAGMLSLVTTPTGGQRRYQYQFHQEQQTTFSYLLTEAKNSLGHPLLEAKYDDNGQALIVRERGIGSGDLYRYQTEQRLVTKSNKTGQETLYHLDKGGLIDSVFYPDERTHFQRWDSKQRIATLETGSGSQVIKHFDDRHRLLEHIDRDGKTTQYTYSGGNPEPISIQSPSGKINYDYDERYNLLSTTDEKGRTEQYQYDDKGDLTQIIDAEDNKKRIEYNQNGQIAAVIDAKKQRSSTQYDTLGRETQFTDAEGRTTNLQYNTADAITRITDPLKYTIDFSYDSEGQLRSIKDPVGNTTRYAYDGKGLLVAQKRANDKVRSYEYLSSGKLSQIVYEDGTVARYEYNTLNQLVKETIGDDVREYAYDDSDHLIKSTSATSTVEFSYNDSGLIETQIQDDLVVERAYVDDKLVDLSFLDQSTTYQRDKQGLLADIRIGTAETPIEQYYDHRDVLIKRTYPNQQVEHIEYDEIGTVKHIQTAKQTLPYKTDKTGFVTQKDQTAYEYDAGGRLVRAGLTVFEYDKAGNVLQQREISAEDTAIFTNIYDEHTNQLLENETHVFSYDLRGNLHTKTHKASQETVVYTFNARNQLIRVKGKRYDEEGACLVPVDLSFRYDAVGRRIEKRDGDIRYQYLYDYLNIIAIAIYDEDNQRTLVTLTYDETIDTPLSISSPQGTFYYHRDHQGSIVALTDEQGEVVESFVYDNSYGVVRQHTKTVETCNPYCYTGREYDANDLYYYRERYYDATIQRFLSEDPIDFLAGDFNFYRYVASNPVNFIDPIGLESYFADYLGFWMEGGDSRFKRPLGSVKPTEGTYQEIVKIGGQYYHKNTSNVFSSIINYFGGNAVEHKPYDPSSEAFFETALTVIPAAKGAKVLKPQKKKKKKKNKDCKDCKKTTKKPVIFTGAKILSDEQEKDFSINSAMPLVWQRKYDSENANEGLLGQGWTTLANTHLIIKPNETLFMEPNGRALKFAPLQVTESDYWVVEQLTLSRPKKDEYQIVSSDGTTLIFTPSQIKNKYQLAQIKDLNDNSLHYIYNYFEQEGHEDRLTHIMTDDDRVFALRYLDHPKYERLEGVDELIWGTKQDRSKDRPQHRPLVNYRYSDAGDLIEVKNHTGRITRQFEYKNYIMVAHKVPEGVESFYEYTEYTPKGKVTRNWVNTGESWVFDYQHQKTIVTDHTGRQTTYFFDKDEYHTGTTDALGQSLKKELDNDGLPEKIINEAGQEKSFIYDSRGNAILIRDYDGTTLQVSYHDNFNQPVEIVDDLGNTTAFEYDDKGNLIKEAAADGAVTSYERDSRGLPISITDNKGGKNHLKYDAAGNVIQRTDCSGHSTFYNYDRHGNLIGITDALNQHTRYVYNTEHHLTQVIYPDQSEERFSYNANDQLTAYTDPKGHQTTYELDIEGKPTKRTNALGGELEYQYDSHGRLIRLINENKAQYKFAYDPLDRLIHEQGVDGLITGYSYDPIGNVIQKLEDETGKAQRKTRFVRNTGGRLLEKYIAKGDMHSRTRYQYDEIGQLTQARNEHSRVDLSYDPVGRLLSETTTTEHGSHALEHQYDGFGNRIASQLPNGKTLNWLYYGSGHLHQINLDGEVICDYQRDALHREISRSQGQLHSTQSYDPLGRVLQQQTVKVSADSFDSDAKPHPLNQHSKHPILLSRGYRYDKAGELIQIDDQRNGITQYQYDALGRITKTEQAGLSERFAFDPAHNIIPPDQASDEVSIQDNRLRVFEDKRYDYDAFGNMIEKRIGKHTQMQFEYDAEHQMKTAKVHKNGVVQDYHYAYDPFGRRISKTDRFNSTHFIWDGNRLLSETRGSQTKTYVYEQDGFVPVAQVDNQGIQYYHTDHLGTPRELTDSEGEITWEATYQTWGNTLKVHYQPVEAKIAPEVQPLRFQGQYFDSETGLHYNRFRYYDPDIGRFVSQDPIGLLGGDNFYQYSPNPIVWM